MFYKILKIIEYTLKSQKSSLKFWIKTLEIKLLFYNVGHLLISDVLKESFSNSI